MRPTYTPEAEAYREKVQAFLAEKLPANWKGIGALDGKELETFINEWRVTLAQSGYLAPGWPVEYGGGGLSALEQVVLGEEFARGEFGTLKRWLNEEIHAHGKRYTPTELCQRITGKPLSADPLLRHLESKLKPLHGL